MQNARHVGCRSLALHLVPLLSTLLRCGRARTIRSCRRRKRRALLRSIMYTVEAKPQKSAAATAPLPLLDEAKLLEALRPLVGVKGRPRRVLFCRADERVLLQYDRAEEARRSVFENLVGGRTQLAAPERHVCVTEHEHARGAGRHLRQGAASEPLQRWRR
jgi:hypothetical protein